MSQWHKLRFDKNNIPPIGEEIVIRPHVDGKGKKTLKASHEHHPWHDLDWSKEASEGMAHLHDGKVDHIRLHQQARPSGVSVHALWHDKDGNVIRRDAHFQAE